MAHVGPTDILSQSLSVMLLKYLCNFGRVTGGIIQITLAHRHASALEDDEILICSLAERVVQCIVSCSQNLL